MSVKGLRSPAGKEPKSESLFFNRRSHQEFSSADGKRGTTCAVIHAETCSSRETRFSPSGRTGYLDKPVIGQLAGSFTRPYCIVQQARCGGPMIPRSSTLVLAFFLWSAALFHSAQSQEQSAPQTPPDQSTYAFHTNTRVVLTDVTVTDTNGNPVHGLPQSVFRVFDNKEPQVVASFEEHAGIPAATIQSASTAGVYSNDYLLHLPPVLNIVLIDIVNIDMADQMYLNYELTRFLNEQPEGQPLAIYLRAGSGCFLVQNFTSDRKLRLDALHKAIPRFPPLGREYLTDFDTLHQIAASLSQLPGRKNVLWFSGGSTHILLPDAIPVQNDAAWRDLYDELDQERIAVYPIDARGLIFGGIELAAQHLAMNYVGQATGGQAFYNNNGLKEITEHLLDADGSFYTLTYSPRNLDFDNKWHKVRVEVEGASYHLSYRSGYFADGSVREKDQTTGPRTRLLRNGEKLQVSELRDRPIIFRASVLPASDPAVANLDEGSGSLPLPPPQKGSVPFLIRYTVPIYAVTIRVIDGKHKITLGVAAIGLDRDGSTVEHKAEQLTMTLPEDILRRSPDLPVTVDQQINLSEDDKFLHLGIWDAVNGRFGNIEIPIEVPKKGKQPEANSHN
jgi:VWFA-related protein